MTGTRHWSWGPKGAAQPSSAGVGGCGTQLCSQAQSPCRLTEMLWAITEGFPKPLTQSGSQTPTRIWGYTMLEKVSIKQTERTTVGELAVTGCCGCCYLQVQKEIRQIQGCKFILKRCIPWQKDEEVGVLEEGAVKEAGAPGQSVLLYSLEQSGAGWTSQLLNLLYSRAAERWCLWHMYIVDLTYPNYAQDVHKTDAG